MTNNNVYWQDIKASLFFKLYNEETQNKIFNILDITPVSQYIMFEANGYLKDSLDISLNYINPTYIPISNSICESNINSTIDSLKSSNLFSEYIGDMWVEYDSVKQGFSPSVFFTLKNFNHKTNHDFLKLFSFYEFYNKANIKHIATEVLGLVPSENIISHIAIMTSRESNPFRINIKKSKDNLNVLLNIFKIEPPQIIFDIIALADSLTLTLDITANGVGNRIGYECFFNNQTTGGQQQMALLHYLLNANLISHNAKEAVLQWIEAIPDVEAYEIDRFIKKFKTPYIWKILNHIKLTQEKQNISAKLYLAIGHSWY
jgi:hypothetical protein